MMRRLALCGFAVSLFVVYGVFFTGDIVSGDNLVQYYQTVQVVDRHRLSFSMDDVATILHRHDLGLNTRFGVNRDPSHYAQVYGLGQSLMTLPLFVGLRVVRNALHLTIPTDLTLWCMNWLFFALLCVMLVLGMCWIAGVPGVAWPTLITWAAAFSSPIWMFSDLPFNVVGETLVMAAAIALCLLLSAGRLGANDARDSITAAALAALLMFGVAVRPFFATAIPAFVGWFCYSIWHSALSSARKRRALTIFAVMLVAGGAALAAFNTYYFGSPLTSAYHDLAGVLNFDGPWSVGMSGTFLSPLRSPLYFFPLVALLPVALAILVWRRDPVAWFVILLLLPHVYLIPKYSMWGAGPDLFSRHWLRILPIVFLSLATAAAGTGARTLMNAGLFAATLSLTALGLRAQLLTTMTDERGVYARAVTEIERQSPGNNEFLYRESIPQLVVGRTLVSSLQMADTGAPRRFLWFRDITRPSQRLPAAVAGLFVSTLSLVAFWARRGERLPLG